MTLTITVLTPKCIYQCADQCLTNLDEGTPYPFTMRKVHLVNRPGWSATVCFSGLGRAGGLDVSRWLSEITADIGPHDQFSRLVHAIQTADTWLANVAPPNNRHSFSIGAFVGTAPIFALMSNFENPPGNISQVARPRLSVFQRGMTRPAVFVSGQRSAVDRETKKRLLDLALTEPDPAQVYSALAEVNREVAKRTTLVSGACFTSHLRSTGTGGGVQHGDSSDSAGALFGVPVELNKAIRVALAEAGAPEPRIVSVAMVRSAPSAAFHKAKLQDTPNDPDSNNNYGVYLQNRKGDIGGAERAYRRAIELDPEHSCAQANLANLLEGRDPEEARRLWQRALLSNPANQDATLNYAWHCSRNKNMPLARSVLDAGIARNPDAHAILLDRAWLSLLEGDGAEAVERLERARDAGADAAVVAQRLAVALQLSGAPVGACIYAYRQAIAFYPGDGGLRVNLAQLLFLNGDSLEGADMLSLALRSGVTEAAELEVQFYLAAHEGADIGSVVARCEVLLSRGARLAWSVEPTIALLLKTNPARAGLLTLLAKILRGETADVGLKEVVGRWV